ncbi:MAG: DUF1214 domain-containing protein [Vicinamibacterales bacterium]|jgi:hypothetical protein|nr:DUF1214 domain-containing protein [Vicinamibacterales bacterium]
MLRDPRTTRPRRPLMPPIVCAGAWGLFPNKDAVSINHNGHLSADTCHTATCQAPENSASWSITVYGADGYMRSVNGILSASNTTMHADGTFTVHSGSKEACGDVPNRLDVSGSWVTSTRPCSLAQAKMVTSVAR